jgi:hypothetical protein
MSDRPMNSPLLKTPTTPKTSYVLLSNISWDHLEKLDVDLQGAGARLTYLDKILEIISPLSPLILLSLGPTLPIRSYYENIKK